MTPPTKRGLCWPVENHGKDDPILFTKPGSKITWLYNWSPHRTPNAGGTLEFVPMQWNHVHIDDLAHNLRESTKEDSHNETRPVTVLGFNEPELPDQSNMPVDLAAAEWVRCIEPLRQQGIRCGSPGISSAPHAVGYMAEFLSKIRARGSDVDFFCFHWYGTELGPFIDYIWSTRYQLDPEKHVWITEYACTNWSVENPLPREHVENFARESANYLDTLKWVERYAWFGPMRDPGTVGRWAAMLDGEGKLTRLGEAYMYE